MKEVKHRASYTAETRAKVALEAVHTTAANASRIYGVEKHTVIRWRNTLRERAYELYLSPPKYHAPKPKRRRRVTYKETTLARALLHIFSKKRKKISRNAKIIPLPKKPIPLIEHELPPSPKDYINGLPKEEKETVDFLYRSYVKMPWMGAERMAAYMQGRGFEIGKTKIKSYLSKIGVQAVYPTVHARKKKYPGKTIPYLLRNMNIFIPNQVWSTDITYINSLGYTLYLAVVVDWHSRKVLNWKLSDTLAADLVIETLREAFVNYGVPSIINTDQGSQFASKKYRNFLVEHKIRQSMDTKNKYTDNIMIERWFRSLKNELIYLQSFDSRRKLVKAIKEYVDLYNSERPHKSFGHSTPNMNYYSIFIHSPVLDTGYQKELDRALTLEQTRRKASQQFQQRLVIPEDTAKLMIADYQAGLSISGMMPKYNRSWRVIHRTLQEHGIDVSSEELYRRREERFIKNRKYSKQEIIDKYNVGLTIVEVAEAVGVSIDAVKKVLHENNVRMRTKADYYRVSSNIDVHNSSLKKNESRRRKD